MSETKFVGMVADQGDVLPELIVTTVERVQPGEIYWGCVAAFADDTDSSKGWLIEREGRIVEEQPRAIQYPVAGGQTETVWRLGPYQFKSGAALVLVQRRR